ncbi:EamA-like transporter family protein [Salinibacterium sp. dk2585]|nr:EamA-like transporter family protein [Salinibacterium sp. dk2585]TXK53697.1 EamA-like transporter family protein [Salinibacterium sp. dk5596]
MPFALLGAGIAGSFIAIQSRVNGGLAQQLGDGIVAAAISLLVGLSVLCIIACLSPQLRTGLRRVFSGLRSGQLQTWTLGGGLMGSLFVLSQSLLTPAVGIVLFTLGIVAGQATGGLLMDRTLIGPAGRVSLTPQRVLGAVLVVLAVLIAGWDTLGHDLASWLVVAPVVVGVGVSWQVAINGVLRETAGSAIAVAFVTFLVGAAALVACALVSIAFHGWPPAWPTSPWLYLGGVFGIVFVAVSTSLVRMVGVLLLGMASVAGQLLSSLAIEWMAPLTDGVSTSMIVGASLALVAVALAAIPARR